MTANREKRERPKGYKRDPSVCARISASTTKALADPAVRARMSAARVQSWADPAKGPLHLRGLTPAQREAYRLYRRKGFNAQESLAAVSP